MGWWGIARSLDRSVARSIAQSLDRSVARSLARSLDPSVARSDRSIARAISRTALHDQTAERLNKTKWHTRNKTKKTIQKYVSGLRHATPRNVETFPCSTRECLAPPGRNAETFPRSASRVPQAPPVRNLETFPRSARGCWSEIQIGTLRRSCGWVGGGGDGRRGRAGVRGCVLDRLSRAKTHGGQVPQVPRFVVSLANANAIRFLSLSLSLYILNIYISRALLLPTLYLALILSLSLSLSFGFSLVAPPFPEKQLYIHIYIYIFPLFALSLSIYIYIYIHIYISPGPRTPPPDPPNTNDLFKKHVYYTKTC